MLERMNDNSSTFIECEPSRGSGQLPGHRLTSGWSPANTAGDNESGSLRLHIVICTGQLLAPEDELWEPKHKRQGK